MKKYADFQELMKEMKSNGFRRKVIDRYRIAVLQGYREAARFAVPVLLTVVSHFKESLHAEHIPTIKEVIAECEEILKDKTIYMPDGKISKEVSEEIDEKVRIADMGVCHAGNLCNNFVPGMMPEDLHEIVLRARDICDAVTRRVRIGS